MANGPTTRSQGRALIGEALSGEVSTINARSDPDNLVSEPPATGLSSPPPSHDPISLNDNTQLRISMELLSAQMRWVVDELREMQRERARDREEWRRPPFSDGQSSSMAMAGDGSQPINSSLNRPLMLSPSSTSPLLPNPFSATANALVLSPNYQPPFFTNAPSITFSAPIHPNGGGHTHNSFPSNFFNPHTSNSSYSLKPRPYFPLFTGKDAHNWIYRVEHLLDYYEVPPDQRVRNAALYLDEGPLQWYRWWVKSRGEAPSWPEFLAALTHQLGPTLVPDYKGSLTKLMQTREFMEYQSEFMRLSHHVDGLSEEFMVSCFISGLKDELKCELMMKSPTTVAMAMRLAKLKEEKLAAVRRNAKPPPHYPSTSGASG